jgi:hypothetical protein
MRRVSAVLLLAGDVHGLDNGLGLLPLRGISSWCVQGQCGWDRCWDAQYRSLADAMVDEGFLSAGYEYALIDDCWVAGRDNTTQELYADPTRFPDGIEAVADYFHSRGLKVRTLLLCAHQLSGGWAGALAVMVGDSVAPAVVSFVTVGCCTARAHVAGCSAHVPLGLTRVLCCGRLRQLGIYTDLTTAPCIHGQYDREHGKVPGSYGHYEQDAATFARWGADMVKADFCNAALPGGGSVDPEQAYPAFSAALNATGRPM